MSDFFRDNAFGGHFGSTDHQRKDGMIVRIRPFLNVKKISKALAAATEPDEQRVKEFQSAFASWLGAANAIAVDRGRAALLLALKILGIREGDEVIVQSYIFHVVVDAILEIGARPVLADSGEEDFNVSPAAIARELTSRTKAIIVTHLGIPCDMEEITGIARKHGCYLIENCAHTLGAECDGKKTGTFGDVSFFSFDVDKPISTGDGGMLVINNESLLEKAHAILDGYRRVAFAKEKEIVYGLLLHHLVTGEDIYPENGFLPVDFGKEAVKSDPCLLSLVESSTKRGDSSEFRALVLPYLRQRHLLRQKEPPPMRSFVSRVRGRAHFFFGRASLQKIDSHDLLMNSLRSAVGMACLKDYTSCKAIRDRNVQYYVDHLDNAAYRTPRVKEGKKPAFIRYAVLNNTRHENSFITRAAREKGLEIGIFNWSAPIHRCYPYNRLLSFDRAKLQNSEILGARLLSLPVHPYLSEGGLKKIVGFLNGFSVKKGIWEKALA